MSIEVKGLETAAKDMERLARAAPGTLARVLNETTAHIREELVRDARERYAVNEAGGRHLDDLRQTVRANAAQVRTVLRIKKMRNDLGYFETNPSVPLPGNAWRLAPRDGFAGRVLKSSAMKTLGGTEGLGKAFLARFASGHVGMVQRVMGSSSKHTVTRTGKPRWRNRAGKVEKLQTLGSPSAAAMINTVWPGRDEEGAAYFAARLERLLR